MDKNTGTLKLISTPDAAAHRSISIPDSAITKRSTGNITRTLLTPCRRIGLGRPSTGSLKKCGLSGMFRSPTVSNENSPVIPKNVDFSPKPINEMLIISPLTTRNTGDKLHYQKSELKSTPVSSKTNGHAANKCSLIRRNLTKQSGIKRCLNDSTESKTNKSILIKEKDGDNNNIENVSNDSVDKDNSVTDECKTDTDSDQTHLQESDDKKQKLEITNRTLADIAERILKKRKQLEDLRIQETYAKKNDLNTLRDLTKTWRKAGQEALHQMLKMAGDMGYKVTLLELIQQYNFPLELIRFNTELEDFEYDSV